MEHIYTYHSVSEFGEHIRSLGNDRLQGAALGSIGWTTAKTHGFSLDESILTACKGGAWTKGADKLGKVSFSFDSQWESITKIVETSECGFSPIVPHAIMGLPNAMLNIRRDAKPRKVISIGFDISLSARTDETLLFNRGRAMLEVVDFLESIGYAIELWGVSNVVGGSTNIPYTVHFNVKQLNEQTNLSAIAFAFCNSAITRRLVFRHVESNSVALSNDLYGIPREWTSKRGGNYDVYFRSVSYDEENYETPDKARLHIINSILKATNAAE